MEVPESLQLVIREATAKHADDIDAAVDEAERGARKLSDFDSFVDALVRHALLELVYDERHTVNVQTKRQAGYYGGGAKVKPGESVESVYRSVYAYHTAGGTLGKLLGEELLAVAEKERAIAGGHLFNDKLLRELREVVPDGKRVEQAVPEKKLRLIFKRLQQGKTAAA